VEHAAVGHRDRSKTSVMDVQRTTVCDICQRQSAATAGLAKIEGAGTLMQ
jgi:hypothetical protein